MRDSYSFESAVYKLGYALGTVLVAAGLCGIQRCFRGIIQRWLEIDIEEDQSIVSEGNETPSIQGQRIGRRFGDPVAVFSPPGLQTTVLNHTHLNVGNLNCNSVSVVNHSSSMYFSNQALFAPALMQTSFQGPGLFHQVQHSIPQQERMSHMMSLPENSGNVSDNSQLSGNISDTRQQINSSLYSRTNHDTESEGNENSDRQVILRIFFFFLMWLYLYDFCADAVLSSRYFVRGEIKDFILSIAPGSTSVLFSIVIILYIAATHTRMSCCFVFLVFVTSPIAKALIYGWMVNTGEPSWYKHWYFHVLTFLQVIEVCIEGIPQLILQYDIIFTESQTLYQSLQSLQWWSLGSSMLAVLCSITSITATLDREEDTRKILEKIVNWGLHHEYYWKHYKEQNKIYWYPFFAVVFVERALEFLPRCFLYATFAKAFGLRIFGFVIAVYAVLLSIVSISCFRKSNVNDKHLRPLFLISSIIGVFANLFYCYEWNFRFLWKKKYFYIRYFALFYAVNLALCIANISFLGGIMFYVRFIPIAVVLQILFLLLRVKLRKQIRAGLKNEIGEL